MDKSDFNGIKTALQLFSSSLEQQDYLKQFRNIEKTISQVQNSIKTVTEPAWSIPSYSFNVPWEIDIFSDLKDGVFDVSKNKQMASFIRKFRQEFYQRVKSENINVVLPKLEYFVDEDKSDMIRLASTWSQGNAMLYFSFEEKEEDSSFGLIWNEKDRKNYESRTGNMYLNDGDEIVREVCDFILRVFV